MKNVFTLIVIGILFLIGFTSIPIQAGPALQPLTSPDSQVIDMIQQVNESLLYDYLSHLIAFGPRYTGSNNCTRAGNYIYDSFDKMGLDVDFHEWQFDHFYSKNVVATLHGTDVNSSAEYILCAHYDTIKNSPGAIDDGSGVAAVLSAAKILSQYSFKHTIRFIAFSGEEQILYGSFLYAREAAQRNDNIIAVINMEGIGFANTPVGEQTLVLLYPERSKWIGDFVSTVNTLYRNQTQMNVELSPGSIDQDFYSFVDYGYDAACAFLYDFPDPWSNSANDTLDHINWKYITKSTKLVLAVVAEFASTPIELQVCITKPYQGYFYLFNNPLQSLDFWKHNYHGLRGTTFIFGAANLTVDVMPYKDIKYVLFCIDGNFIDWANYSSPHYEWKIKQEYYPTIGRHRVEVYAYTYSGKIAYDEIKIASFTLFYVFSKHN